MAAYRIKIGPSNFTPEEEVEYVMKYLLWQVKRNAHEELTTVMNLLKSVEDRNREVLSFLKNAETVAYEIQAIKENREEEEREKAAAKVKCPKEKRAALRSKEWRKRGRDSRLTSLIAARQMEVMTFATETRAVADLLQHLWKSQLPPPPPRGISAKSEQARKKTKRES